jgi:hypothetical protein
VIFPEIFSIVAESWPLEILNFAPSWLRETSPARTDEAAAKRHKTVRAGYLIESVRILLPVSRTL